MRGHFITTKKLMMMKKIKYALIVRSFLEQRLTSPAIDIVSTIKKMTTSVITVKVYFRLRVILKNIYRKSTMPLKKNLMSLTTPIWEAQ